ncbi:MAG: LuxR family transcriptional regulator [Gemmatimonadetes bacterium]|nr:LuxR family transcriptional regulator [Gemmatimonadota bacterium]
MTMPRRPAADSLLRALAAESRTGRTADHETFLRALDAVTVGLLFWDLSRGPIHANRWLRDTLGSRGDGERVGRELQAFAERLAWRVLRRKPRGADVVELAARELRSSGVRHWMRGSYIGLNLLGSGPCLLIAIKARADTPFPSLAELRVCFGLSSQESRVALLLAQGSSNVEVASALSISPHTARRHTERVLAKLGVHSRAEVAARVLESGRRKHTEK